MNVPLWMSQSLSKDDQFLTGFEESLLANDSNNNNNNEYVENPAATNPTSSTKPTSPIIIAICMIGMGASTFATSEALFLQTEMFTKCFNYSNFFGVALMCLFLPGLIVQILQNQFDEQYNRKFSTRTATAFRISIGQTFILVPCFVFFTKLHQDHPNQLASSPPPQSLLIGCFIFIGFGCAFVYGSSSQIVALLPSKFHAYFFVGAYLNSIVMAPVNTAVGQLFTIKDHQCTEIYWNKITKFYAISTFTNCFGVLSFVVLCYCTVTGKRAVMGVGTNENDNEEGGGIGLPMEFVLNPASPTLSERGRGIKKINSGQIWRQLFGVGLTMVLVLVENMLVSSSYHKIPVAGQIFAIPTVMMYSFYMSMCVGSMTSSFKCVQKKLTTSILFGLTLLRVPGVVLIYWYVGLNPIDIRNGTAPINPGDYGVLVFGSIYIWLGGIIFSRSFSIATEMFTRPEEKAVSATVMNVLYFFGICAVSTGILLTA